MKNRTQQINQPVNQSQPRRKQNVYAGWKAPVKAGQLGLIKVVNPNENDPQWRAADQLLKSVGFEA